MMFLDWAMMYPTPLKIEAVPRVMMSGWIFSLMESIPLIIPRIVPSTNVKGMAIGRGICQSTIIMDKTILVRMIWEPMERSMPPPIITNMSPTALMATKDTWRISIRILNEVMKLGEINVNSITRPIRIMRGA